MTLTEWWELLTASLDDLHQCFPSAGFGYSPLFRATSQIAMHGIKLERYDDSLTGLLSTRKASGALLQEEDKLGKKVVGVNGTRNHIPNIIVPLDALIAVSYYEHLVRYRDVISTRGILNEGTWLNPGIQARKVIVSQHANVLKDDIICFLEDYQNVLALQVIHPAFGALLKLTHPQEKFRVFSDLALGRAPLPHLPERTFEEKLGDRLEAQFLAAATVLSPVNAREQLSQNVDETITVLEAIRTCKHALDTDNSTDVAMHDTEYAMLDREVTKLDRDTIKFHASDLDARSDRDLRRLVNKTQLLARILKMSEHLSEFTQTHHTWFTRKLHSIFTWFREQDSYFLKTFFVPDSWKFIYEAEKLGNELGHLEEKLHADSVTDASEVEKAFTSKLMNTRSNVLSIHRESLFFGSSAQNAKNELENGINSLLYSSGAASLNW